MARQTIQEAEEHKTALRVYGRIRKRNICVPKRKPDIRQWLYENFLSRVSPLFEMRRRGEISRRRTGGRTRADLQVKRALKHLDEIERNLKKIHPETTGPVCYGRLQGITVRLIEWLRRELKNG